MATGAPGEAGLLALKPVVVAQHQDQDHVTVHHQHMEVHLAQVHLHLQQHVEHLLVQVGLQLFK